MGADTALDLEHPRVIAGYGVFTSDSAQLLESQHVWFLPGSRRISLLGTSFCGRIYYGIGF